MSGGLAFVLDEDGTFRARVNPAMLDQLEPLDEADAIEVRELVAEHVRRTGSPVGRARARRVGRAAGRSFVKVFPTDYKRVLARARAPQEAAAAVAAAARRRVRRREPSTSSASPHVRTGRRASRRWASSGPS